MRLYKLIIRRNIVKMKQTDGMKNKKPYEKPKLRIIEMETDQVLVVGCKMEGVGAPTNPTSCSLIACVEDGS